MSRLASLLIVLTVALSIVGCSSGSDANAPGTPSPTPASDPKSSNTTNDPSMSRTAAKGDAVVTEEALGVPFYPESTEEPVGSMTAEAGGERAVNSVRYTKDDPSKVIEFYKSKVKNGKELGTGDHLMLSGSLEPNGKFSLQANKEGDKTTIRIGTSFKK